MLQCRALGPPAPDIAVPDTTMHLASASPARNEYAYLPGIDGLRAIAVLAVILFHLHAPALPGGFSGVDVFFVISGYVVSKSLAATAKQGGLAFLTGFYARRLLRLYPALVAMLLGVTVLQTLFVPASWLSSASAHTGLAAFFGLSNLALLWFNDGYFSPRIEFNPFAHTWSLAVEEQFYLLFPALFLLWQRGESRRPAVRRGTRMLLPALLVLSVLLCWQQSRGQPQQAYYLLPSRFWELACGALLFRLHHGQQCLPASARQAASCILAGLLLIAAGFGLADPQAFPFPWAMLPVAGSALVICGVATPHAGHNAGQRLLANSGMRYLGRLSYSLYLWHWPLIVLLRWTVGMTSAYHWLLAVAATLLASMLSYHVLECPLRQRLASGSTSDARRVVLGGASVLACAVLALGVSKAQPYLSLSVTRDSSLWYPYPVVAATRTPAAAHSVLQQRRLYVLGDSHTGAYRTLLSLLSEQQGMMVRDFSQAGCAVAGLLTPQTPACTRFVEDSLAQILGQARPGDMVWLASLRVPRLSDQWTAFDAAMVAAQQHSQAAGQARAQAWDEAARHVERLQQAGLVVIIDAPKPVFPAPPFRCADWFNRHNPVCAGGLSLPRSQLLAHRQASMQALAKLQQAYPKLVVWDPFPILCPTQTCHAYDGARPLFFDGDHLSGHGNRVLYPALLQRLQAVAG